MYSRRGVPMKFAQTIRSKVETALSYSPRALLLSALLIGGSTSFAMNPGHAYSAALNMQLSEAVLEGNIQHVKALLDAGASANTQDYRGWTPLNRAARSGDKYICQLLLDHNAQTDIKNDSGWTPLMNAAYHGHRGICALLLDRNALPASKNNNDCTPLMLAATRCRKKICHLLIDKMIKPIKQSTGSIIVLLGCNRKRRANLLCLLPRDIAIMLARQLYKPVAQKKKSLFRQIDACKNQYIKNDLYVYAWLELASHSKINEEKSLEPNQKRSKTDDDE